MISQFLKDELTASIREAFPEDDGPSPAFGVLPSEHADYASNVAMVLAAQAGQSPRDVAETLVQKLEGRETFTACASVEIAGGGFLNFTLAPALLRQGLEETRRGLESGYGFLTGRKDNIEFISANPTGKLHIGHGRGAFFGDALANILTHAGALTAREYYVNNSRQSKQIKELGKTALGRGEEYKTPALEEKIEQMDFSGLDETEAGLRLAREVQKENAEFVTHTLGVSFDLFFDEDEKLVEEGGGQVMLEKLRAEELTYTYEGAEWLKTSAYGDDEDRVVVRSDGSGSYFLSDIAYHDDKFSRELDNVLNIWGADHGGHEKRMQAVKKMLDWPGELHIFIAQLVMLKGEGGEREKMSKRAGNVILLEELVEQIELDVVRWFFLEKTLSTQMDFDMALARETSEKNPVRYVQYAHARCCSVLKKADRERKPPRPEKMDTVFGSPSAHTLAVMIIQYSEKIEEITRDYGVHKMTTYAYELAGALNHFYRDVRVIESDDSINREALELTALARETLASSLKLLGISAPEKM